MADDRLKILEERLMRLEAAMAQQPTAQPPVGRPVFTSPGGVVVDPAPYPGGWGFQRPIPTPVVDPAPWPWYGGGHYRWPPNVVVDPAPMPNPVFDPTLPATSTVSANLGRIGPIGDPPPIDITRFTASQLESALHSINAEKARLTSMETMITQQLEKLNPKKKG